MYNYFIKLLKAPTAKEIHRLQLVLHLLALFCLFYSPILFFIGLFYGWIIANLGGSLIGHRYVSHNQFQIKSNFVKGFFYTLYNLNLIGSAVNYANIHILHHQNSDDLEEDPTTWKRPGLLKCHLSLYEYNFNGKIKLRYYKQLMKDPFNKFFHQYYYLPVFILSLITLIFGLEYFLGLVAVPAMACFHIAQLQVSILHYDLPGSYRTDKSSEAYNIPWLKFILMGEELHNNHHAYPNSANRQLAKGGKEFDPIFTYVIKPFFRFNT